ncbi:MAG: CvpA family protein [Clostridia bacterium]|nr:CvpA family protein [Clostridia bacterium]
MNYILDLILTAVLVLFFLRGWKRGFVMELVDLIGVILSAVLAMIFGGIVADWVYATFMRAPLAERIGEVVTSATPSMAEIKAVLDGFPAFIERGLEHYGVTAESLFEAASSAEGALPVALADAVSPVIVLVIKFFAVLLLFFVFMLGVRVIARALNIVVRLPLIRQVNELLGGGLSLVKGVVVVWLVCASLNIVVPMLRPSARDFMESSIHASFIFDMVYEHNPIYSMLL